jgi:hypothetical protein
MSCRNCDLKSVAERKKLKGWKDEEEDVSSF